MHSSSVRSFTRQWHTRSDPGPQSQGSPHETAQLPKGRTATCRYLFLVPRTTDLERDAMVRRVLLDVGGLLVTTSPDEVERLELDPEADLQVGDRVRVVSGENEGVTGKIRLIVSRND